MSNSIEDRYNRRKTKYTAFYETVHLKIKQLILFKLITVFGGLGITVLFLVLRFTFLGAGAFLAMLLVYLFLNLSHDKAAHCETLGNSLAGINHNGLLRLSGEWTSFSDKGEELVQIDHFYAEDLDILGQGSVFQLVNSCQTPLGRKKLNELLCSHPESTDEIKRKQEAVVELARRLFFRQRLQAEGMTLKESSKEINKILDWGKNVNEKLLDKRIQLFLKLLPVITALTIIPGYFRLIPILIPVLLVILQILLLRWKIKHRSDVLNTAYALKYRLEPYSNMLKLIEKTKFRSSVLHEVQNSLYMNQSSPSKQLDKLSRICSNISNRNNMFYFVFDVLTLWDYQCEVALEKWKQECGKNLLHWFEGIAAFEALSSLSNLKHDNPDWAMPDIIESHTLQVKAIQAGHPLITKGRISNDFELGNNRKVILVTGSNMSGKSTFLRTIGLNLVLAYSGAPVCAHSFSCSLMNVCTCMRISDNLEKNISSFYAELLRIKMIVEAVKTKGRIFFLLDEIFKGTNSYDRHHAAKVLISKLAGRNSIGMVSTHDLELEVLEKETNGLIANYHFQEHYNNGQIKFDYKLRPGVSKTRNAIYLIEALGIELK
ncbi:MAG: DNA mismatch repair protein [Thermoclostridium sp.]|nr:DNA mismatch repair protein [Thermoclostridium sp.]